MLMYDWLIPLLSLSWETHTHTHTHTCTHMLIDLRESGREREKEKHGWAAPAPQLGIKPLRAHALPGTKLLILRCSHGAPSLSRHHSFSVSLSLALQCSCARAWWDPVPAEGVARPGGLAPEPGAGQPH